MKRIIADIKAYSKGSKLKVVKTILLNYNFHCVLIYRISYFFNKMHLPIFSEILKFINRVIYSVDIDYRADLAGGFVLVHGAGVVIGANVKTIGPLKIYQGVTLGGNNGKIRYIKDTRVTQPIVGKNVILCANASVFGPVVIGDNSIIGAGTIITRDIDKNSTVIMKRDLLIKKNR